MAYWDQWGGKSGYAASQQKRYEEAVRKGDTDLINRLKADAARVGYSLSEPRTSSPSPMPPSGTYTADGKFIPKAQEPVYSSTGTIYREPEPRRDTRDIYSQLTQSLQEYSYPYEQLMRDTLASIPKYTPRSRDELLSEAQRQASLQVDPQLQALQKAYQQSLQGLTAREEQARAAHAGYESDVARALSEAAKIAQEQAIARGGGRAGLLDWGREQRQQPIIGAAERQAAELAAYLQDIASQRSLATQQYGESEQQLAERRGLIEAQTVEELKRYDDAMARGDWQMANQASQNLAALATQAQQFTQQTAASLLPYLEMTEQQRQYLPIDIANVAGEWPEGYSSASSPASAPVTQPIGLREYVAGQGGTLSYDPATKTVTVNGRNYGPGDLEAMGGVLKDGRWYLPQSAAARL